MNKHHILPLGHNFGQLNIVVILFKQLMNSKTNQKLN